MPFPFVGITTTFAVSIIPSDYRKVSSATRETGKGRMTFFTTPSRLRGEARTIVSFYFLFHHQHKHASRRPRLKLVDVMIHGIPLTLFRSGYFFVCLFVCFFSIAYCDPEGWAPGPPAPPTRYYFKTAYDTANKITQRNLLRIATFDTTDVIWRHYNVQERIKGTEEASSIHTLFHR